MQEFPRIGGTLVIANQQSHSAYLISLKDGKVVRKIETGPGPHEAAVSPDGKTAVVTIYGNQQSVGASLLVIDIASGKAVKTVSTGTYTRPHGAAFVDNDRVIVTSETTKNLVLVNLKDEKVERAMSTDAPGSHMLALAKDGKYVYSANIPVGTVTKFEVATGKKVGEAQVGKGSEGIGISPDGKTIYTANRGDQTLSAVDTETMKSTRTVPAPGLPYRAAFSADGKRALIPNPVAGALMVVPIDKPEDAKNIEMAKGKVTFPVAQGPSPAPGGISVHPGGKYVFLTIINAASVAVVDLDKGEVVARVETGISPDGIAYSPVEVKD